MKRSVLLSTKLQPFKLVIFVVFLTTGLLIKKHVLSKPSDIDALIMNVDEEKLDKIIWLDSFQKYQNEDNTMFQADQPVSTDAMNECLND